MKKQQEALTLAEDLMADIEFSRTTVDKHVLKAMRLARLLGDDEAQRWLGYEIHGVPATDEGHEWMTRVRRWTDQDAATGYWSPTAEMEAHRNGAQAARDALGGAVSLSGDYVTTAMRERSQSIGKYTSSVTAMTKVLAAVDSEIYRYASDVYAELQFSEIQADLFQQSQEKVDAVFAAMAGSALKKIESINERLRRDDAEAVSQAMTTCRRLIDSVADHVFPAKEEPYKIGDQELVVKQNNVLNRINACLHTLGVTGGRADRLRRSLSDIYGRVSKAVHDDVDGHEARYLFLTTYVTLGEVLTVGQVRSSSHDPVK
jgi:AbiTii